LIFSYLAGPENTGEPEGLYLHAVLRRKIGVLFHSGVNLSKLFAEILMVLIFVRKTVGHPLDIAFKNIPSKEQ
jgi:hypothetical protein